MAASTNELVQDVLESVKKQFKSITVEKDIEVDVDCGNLLVCDQNPIDIKLYRSNRNEFISSLARDNTQLLFNQIWKLPIHKVDDVVVAEIPDPQIRIPREKPVPKAKKLTKWQEYAELKGIQKRKRSRLVFDEETKEWVPRFGYKSKNDLKKDWLLEVPDNADPFEDQFAKKKGEKKERVAKNELQRLRNIARAQKSKVPGIGLIPKLQQSQDEVNQAFHLAKKSTASIGRFEEKLPKEIVEKNSRKKRKFEPTFGQLDKEKDREKKILNHILLGKPKLDIAKAVNKEMRDGEVVEDERESRRRQKGRGSKKALPKSVRRGNRGNKSSYR
ncbi:ribosome biogenesis regulatory protein homolog [Apostichopus japonicus]|uniref:ribosome biogenesis regulatory protein homolog n=1 Tax=Stichopus japonicus TaxID=307972 RepID=UPI003AB5488E